LDELLFPEAIDKKACGVANWDEKLRSEEKFQRKCYLGIRQSETWTEGLNKLGILATAQETASRQERHAS
jgi:hypothetical protein